MIRVSLRHLVTPSLILRSPVLTSPRHLLFILATCYSLLATAQEERSLTRDGNRLFNKGKYPDAEAAYKKALEKNSAFPEAMFNLGDAMYQQERYDDAISQYELAAKTFTDPKLKGQSYHNTGNCQLRKKEYEKAVEAYKQALKINPADKDTKYNLAYANEKLREKQKQDQQNKNDKNKKDNKDQQKKDQKDKDKKDDKGQKDKDQQGQEDKDKPKKYGEQPKLTKEQAEKLLEALKAEEQKAQEKMQKKNAKPVDAKVEKDW
ncbi:MAG: Tetratricopeptide 2 repeat protein [Bacteroidetes bacterium]|nr:Tetratricopeptide 2 repeat protein [Bacteroidota bacterium]